MLSGFVERRGEARGGPGPSQAGTKEGVRRGQRPSGLLRTPEIPRGRRESDGLPGAMGGLEPGSEQLGERPGAGGAVGAGLIHTPALSGCSSGSSRSAAG